MGNCSSCLGDRRRSAYEEDGESRLLFEDADGAAYGSFGEPTMNAQDDAQETQREFEALQQVVARTSDNMVDIFEIAPQPTNAHTAPTPYALVMPDSRMARYQSLLSKLSAADDDDSDANIDECYDTGEATIQVFRDDTLPTKADASGPFVGNFVDAAKVVP